MDSNVRVLVNLRERYVKYMLMVVKTIPVITEPLVM